ncbi:ciliary microtubule associated protein 1A-like [Oratosquilla oratoria]
MAPRGKEEEDKMKVPGPGAYETSDMDVCKKKNPVFTMSPKTNVPTDHTIKPAPNAYSVEKCEGKQTPQFSFGIKHSPYLGNLRNQ